MFRLFLTFTGYTVFMHLRRGATIHQAHLTCTPDCLSQKKLAFVFASTRFFDAFWLKIHTTTNGTQTDGRTDRQTDDMMMPIADHTMYQYDRPKAMQIG